MMPGKCQHGDGAVVNLFGVPVDPCIYKTVEGYRNVDVYISRCVRCGAVDIRWEPTANTEPIPEAELDGEAP